MNYRTIQSTGGSSYSLVLPKHWIDANKIENKDRVYFEYNKNSLIIRPEFNKTNRKNINLNNLDEQSLRREIISLYLIGADEITIKDKIIIKDKRKEIRDIIQRLAGMEVLYEDKGTVVLKYIYNPEEFSYTKNINRMIDMSINMFKDSLEACLKNDKKLASNILAIDLEINKLCFHIRRNYNTLLEGRSHKENRFSSLLEIKYYEYISIQLERIADHAAQIAAIVVYHNYKSIKEDKLLIEKLLENILPYLSGLKEVIIKVEKDMAHTMINELFKMEKGIYSLWTKFDKNNSAENLVILTSIDRLKSYISNIAERVIFQHYLINED
jgi:phosphate transport system protein